MTRFEIFAVVWPMVVCFLVIVIGITAVRVSERIDDRRRARGAAE